MSVTTLRLGKVDQGSKPANLTEFLFIYHASMADGLKKKNAFRDEADGDWRDITEIEGAAIRPLQQFLKDAGFMPKANVDGVFGYATQAAVRLFQEYLRTVDGVAAIGTPDGIAGPNTLGFVEKWKTERTGQPGFVSKWGQFSASSPSPEFKDWIALLEKAKNHYLQNPNPLLDFIQNFNGKTDTQKIADWDVSPSTVHLIGIRRNQDKSVLKRENDDLFVLLINGMVFKFWGSTDPSQEMAAMEGGRMDEAFLVEGQHVYQFGWHKVSSTDRVYRALRPARHGVLVFRDRNNDDALTDEDLKKGIDAPNTTINIHWSGKGHTSYSAGCQVIAGQSYINHEGKVVNCSAFASPGYEGLKNNLTRGAYNVLTDLILNYAPAGVQTLRYTLARDEAAFLSENMTEATIEGWVSAMKRPVG